MQEAPKGKVVQYENFLNETLKKDLKKLSDQREECFKEIAQFYQLRQIIEEIQKKNNKSFDTQVDLGCNFYAQAVVEDSSMIYVSVGYGFYVEFTHAEALKFITKKISLLEERSKEISKTMNSVKANIRLVMEALRELQLLDT